MTLPKEVRIIIVERMVKHGSPANIFRYLKTNKNVVLSTKALLKLLIKSTTKDVIRNVNENMLTAVIANFCKRVDTCIQEKGGHFGNVINSK